MLAGPGTPDHALPASLQAQATLAREIEHLRAAAALLRIDKPLRSPAAEACLDLARLREAQLLPAARELLDRWRAQPEAFASVHGALPGCQDAGHVLLHGLGEGANAAPSALTGRAQGQV